jgi:hypothetical protein
VLQLTGEERRIAWLHEQEEFFEREQAKNGHVGVSDFPCVIDRLRTP